MSVRRTLVDCAVLSLQDSSVYYPCCKGCFCRIDEDLQDTTRCRCSRCGYSCMREQVDYRYRLSFKVTRDQRIFGITVFGACLNPFFGIPASGLKRLVESLEGPTETSRRSAMLKIAVEDCFIGRHFLFGIKVTDSEMMPWSSAMNRSMNVPGQFTTSQMILPAAYGLSAYSVVSYYQRLLQKAAEFELESADPNMSFRPPGCPLLLALCHSPKNSVTNPTLSISGFDWSLSRMQHHNSALNTTSPWQQSPGLVTSSADCSYEDIQRNVVQTSQIGLDHHNKTETPFYSFESASLNNPSFVQQPSIVSAPEHFSLMGCCLSRNCSFESPARESGNQLPPNTSAVDDFALSESLSEFVCHNNMNLNQTEKSNKEFGSKTNKSLVKSRELRDVSNTRRQSCRDADWPPYEHNNPSVSTHNCNVEDGRVERCHEWDVYDCSADLFSETPTLETNRPDVTCDTQFSADRSLCRSDKRKARPSTSQNKRFRVVYPDAHRDEVAALDLCSDFVPASQSTPIVKQAAAFTCRTLLDDKLVSRPKVRLPFKKSVAVNPPLHHVGVELSKISHPTSCGHREISKSPSKNCDKPVSELEDPQKSAGLVPPQTKYLICREAECKDRSCCESNCVSGDDEACDWSKDLFSDY